MYKGWEASTVLCILVVAILTGDFCFPSVKGVDLNNDLLRAGDVESGERRPKNDFYVFSDNMLQLSSQFPTISPFESLSLMWTSISERVLIKQKNEGALILLYLISPIYKLVTDEGSELEDANIDVDQFEELVSQIVYCLIQTDNEDNCVSKIDELMLLLRDQITNEIQKIKEIDLIDIELSLRINSLEVVLNKIKRLYAKENGLGKGVKLYPVGDSEKFLFNLFNIKNVVDYYLDLYPTVPYIKVLAPLRTLLDIINKDWDMEKNNNVKSWFSNTSSPVKTICDEMIAGIRDVTAEIDGYFEPKKIEKLIILTETRIYLDSLNQFCSDYNSYVNANESSANKIPKELLSLYKLFTEDRERIRSRISKIYENSRKSVDINSNLCIVSSDSKLLSSEGLTENEMYQEVSTTLLDMISNFFIDNSSDADLRRTLQSNCPLTMELVSNNAVLNDGNKLSELGVQIRTLSSILSIKRTHLASRMCSKIKAMSSDIGYMNRRMISINRLLIPIIVNSSIVTILPSNSQIHNNDNYMYHTRGNGKDEDGDSKVVLYIDPDKSCLINNSDRINYYLREVAQICNMVNDYSSLFSAAIRKITHRKAFEQINHKLTRISQSQILHEFREVARDIKGSKNGHFLSEIGNSWSFSLSHWYNHSKRRRKLHGARSLLRKAFYSYTASLDNIRLDLRPELQEIQYNVLMMESNDIRILTSGDFVFLNSKTLDSSYKGKYTRHTSKVLNEYYDPHTQILREDFQITSDNVKELNSLINSDFRSHREELEAEMKSEKGRFYVNSNTTTVSSNDINYRISEKNENNINSEMKEENGEFNDKIKTSVSKGRKKPYFESRGTHFIVVGRDSSSFSLCRCRIKGRKISEMLQLFIDLSFQIRNTDVRVTGYDMLSNSLKKAIRQTLIILVLNEFAVNLLPKVRKGGYQRFYRMKHSTHKALRRRVGRFIKEIKNNTYKLSIVLSTLNTLLLTAFSHFKYDTELNILRRVLLGLDVYKKIENDEDYYAQDNSILMASDLIRRNIVEKLVDNFYFGRIRRSFGSLKETVLQMMNPRQILGLSQAFKTDRDIKDIDLIVDKLYLYLKSIGPSQNCIGVTSDQKLESFFSLC